MPDRDPEPDPPTSDLARRLRALEETVAFLSITVRTRRLAVCDDSGRECIVAEVVDGQAQLRLSFVDSRTPSRRTGVWAATPRADVHSASVLVFACPASQDLGPLAGMQVWADGDAVAAIEAWADTPGQWRSAVHVVGPPPAP